MTMYADLMERIEEENLTVVDIFGCKLEFDVRKDYEKLLKEIGDDFIKREELVVLDVATKANLIDVLMGQGRAKVIADMTTDDHDSSSSGFFYLKPLSGYSRKKLVDIEIDNGARFWDSNSETFDEYMSEMKIPTQVLSYYVHSVVVDIAKDMTSNIGFHLKLMKNIADTINAVPGIMHWSAVHLQRGIE